MSLTPQRRLRLALPAVTLLAALLLTARPALAVTVSARADVLKTADVRAIMSATDTAGLGVLTVDGGAVRWARLSPSTVTTFAAVPMSAGIHRVEVLVRGRDGIARSSPVTVRCWGNPGVPVCAVPANGLQRKAIWLTVRWGGSTTKFTVVANGKTILARKVYEPGHAGTVVVLARGRNTIELRAENPVAKTSKSFQLYRPAWPLPGYHTLSSTFGPRWGRMHEGIDIPAPTGTTAVAAGPGVVASAGSSGDYGNLVVIDHGGGDLTYYGHFSRIGVKKGQKVSEGQAIGRVGSTGNSTGPHLHFEVRVHGSAVDPLNYL